MRLKIFALSLVALMSTAMSTAVFASQDAGLKRRSPGVGGGATGAAGPAGAAGSSIYGQTTVGGASTTITDLAIITQVNGPLVELKGSSYTVNFTTVSMSGSTETVSGLKTHTSLVTIASTGMVINQPSGAGIFGLNVDGIGNTAGGTAKFGQSAGTTGGSLRLYSGSSLYNDIGFTATSSNNAWDRGFFINDRNNSRIITIDLAGKTGIGVSGGEVVPQAQLHVSSGSGETGPIFIVSTGTTKLFQVTGTSVTSFVTMRDANGNAYSTSTVGGGGAGGSGANFDAYIGTASTNLVKVGSMSVVGTYLSSSNLNAADVGATTFTLHANGSGGPWIRVDGGGTGLRFDTNNNGFSDFEIWPSSSMDGTGNLMLSQGNVTCNGSVTCTNGSSNFTITGNVASGEPGFTGYVSTLAVAAVTEGSVTVKGTITSTSGFIVAGSTVNGTLTVNGVGSTYFGGNGQIDFDTDSDGVVDQSIFKSSTTFKGSTAALHFDCPVYSALLTSGTASTGAFFDSSNTWHLSFGASVNTVAQWVGVVREDWKGQTLQPIKFEGVVFSSGATSGNVKLSVQVARLPALNFDLRAPVYDVVNSTTLVVPGTAFKGMPFSIPLTNNNSMQPGDLVSVLLIRDTTVGSNAAGDVYNIGRDRVKE